MPAASCGSGTKMPPRSMVRLASSDVLTLLKSLPKVNCAAPRRKMARPKVTKICTMPRLNRTDRARAISRW